MKDITLYYISSNEEKVGVCTVPGETRGKLRYNKDGTVRVINYPGSNRKNHRNEVGYAYIGFLSEYAAVTRLIEMLKAKVKSEVLTEKINKLKRRIAMLKRYDLGRFKTEYYTRIKL